MKLWNYFWIANFVVAGSSFLVITLVVMVRGTTELLAMLKGLHDKTCNESPPQTEERKRQVSSASQ